MLRFALADAEEVAGRMEEAKEVMEGLAGRCREAGRKVGRCGEIGGQVHPLMQTTIGHNHDGAEG